MDRWSAYKLKQASFTLHVQSEMADSQSKQVAGEATSLHI